ncbi:LEF-5 [Rachiplusia nu nucleopolyhedrovirus]|uniref:LEF-5 n=1 Tax=Rachiplusia nu nucleopolyhedrovirus TaxID=2605775 RepID=A0AAF1DB37_9ABAC|nr:LEF-5 [Rachiplusia nu nucleopolyhedrovirus]QEI03617.1 LEF-5 [Rachiplusia nu nucleopolyhedrovirus]
MAKRNQIQVVDIDQNKNVSLEKSSSASKKDPSHGKHNCYDLFCIFKSFRENKQYSELIRFLIDNYPSNVKNKTFNFVNTGHLFHSLYAYIPAATNVEKERKQIRLSEECIGKLFVNTINDFKLYAELFNMIITQKSKKSCPCELLLQRKQEIKDYVDSIKAKKFDTKPPKLKKESIDNIMYKYSLNWKNLMLKKKLSEAAHDCSGKSIMMNTTNENVIGKVKGHGKKKLKIKKRTILTDEIIYLENISTKYKLPNINGLSLNSCTHEFITIEKQLRAGDEAVSFIKYCRYCNKIGG